MNSDVLSLYQDPMAVEIWTLENLKKSWKMEPKNCWTLFGTKNCQLLSRSDGKVKAEFKEMDASRDPSSGKMIQLMVSELMVYVQLIVIYKYKL